MFFYLKVAVLFFSSTFAAAAPSGEPTPLHLSYAPPQGTTLIEMDYASADSSRDYKFAGFHVMKDEVKTTALAISGFYGVSDRLAVGLRLMQAISSAETAKWSQLYPGRVDEYKSGGTFDPTIGVNWRTQTGTESNSAVDILVLYSPKLMKARSAETNEDGTMGRGGSELTVGAMLVRRLDDLEVSGAVTKKFKSERTIGTSTGDVKNSGGDELRFSGELLREFNGLFLGGGISLAQIEGSTSTSSSGSQSSTDGTTTTGISLRLKSLLTPDSGLRFAYELEDAQTYDTTSGTTTLNISGGHSSGFTLGFSAAF